MRVSLSMFSRCTSEYGVSRNTRISLRRSFRATSPARSIRLLLAPVASAESVPVLQGQIISGAFSPEPEAGGENHSSRPKTCTCPVCALAKSDKASAMAGVEPGSRNSVSVAITTWAALLIITFTRQPLATRHCNRRSPYWAPDAPVNARLTTGDCSATTLLQFRHQFPMNAAKAAITHDHDMTGLWQPLQGLFDQLLHRSLHPVMIQLSVFRSPAVHQFRQPVHITEVTPKHSVCQCGTRNQRLLVHTLLHGIGAGFDNGQDWLIPHPVTQPLQGGRNRGWMMGKVVIYAHTADFAHQLHSALNTGEPAQRRHRMIRRNAHMAGSGNRRQGITHI